MPRPLPAPLPSPVTHPTSITVDVPSRHGFQPLGSVPEDGLLDLVAVQIAMSGERPVELTALERLVAAAQILAAGGHPRDIADRLRVSDTIADSLVRRVRLATPKLRAVLDAADDALRGRRPAPERPARDARRAAA
ncbi:hypothetical protein [Actinomadura atramentaria]|uniref:hypothetical protein n=1 Tax=Actinomadura atramentaria TaxID=1990 RepID=UPI00036AD385|nr:hypothetical protein [Actinomadura atramentaria]